MTWTHHAQNGDVSTLHSRPLVHFSLNTPWKSKPFVSRRIKEKTLLKGPAVHATGHLEVFMLKSNETEESSSDIHSTVWPIKSNSLTYTDIWTRTQPARVLAHKHTTIKYPSCSNHLMPNIKKWWNITRRIVWQLHLNKWNQWNMFDVTTTTTTTTTTVSKC